MINQTLKNIKDELAHLLYIDIDEFGITPEGDEVVSRFSGLLLRSRFQPIHDVTQSNNLIGFEALLVAETGIQQVPPAIAFLLAEHNGQLIKLDRAARTLHLLNYLSFPASAQLLFLNVHPELLLNVSIHGRVFERILHRHSVPTRSVVIEIEEKKVADRKKLQEAVENYRDCGYKIAFDRFGSADSGLDRLWALAPDFVKFDKSIIQNAQTNKRLRQALPKLIELVTAIGAIPIVVGIENALQLQIAHDAGAIWVQGFHVDSPQPTTYWREALKARIQT